MGQRRKSRAAALQALFQLEFSPNEDTEHGLDLYRSQFHRDDETWTYARELVCGVLANKESIDAKIDEQSSHWALNRMPTADLNILRLALYENLYSQSPVPSNVVINEAIEIAKKYGDNESPKFINAILDKACTKSPPPLEQQG